MNHLNFRTRRALSGSIPVSLFKALLSLFHALKTHLHLLVLALHELDVVFMIIELDKIFFPTSCHDPTEP